MNARYSFVSRAVQEIVKQPAADTAAVVARKDREQQQLGFVGDGAEQREADRSPLSRLASDHQRHSAHRQDPGQLRASPGFAKALAECCLHDAHDGVEVVRRPAFDVHILLDRRHHAASGTRASGARA